MIKNYTSGVSAHLTVAKIEATLAKAGVSEIHKEYGPTGTIAALMFSIQPHEKMPALTVRLPVKESAVAQALYKTYRQNTKQPRKTLEDFLEQANRTAWKIMQDWVEIQLTLIAMQQASFQEIFLPFIWNGRSTLYHALTNSPHFKQLALPEAK